MLLIHCPYCGDRPELEFRYGSEAHIARSPQPATVDDEAWAQFLFYRTNTKGVHAERWLHQFGCGRWFNARRETAGDKFLATYRIGERPER